MTHGASRCRSCSRRKTNILATAAGLSDQDLLSRLRVLALNEREASVELVAHLAALDTRPAVYAAQGYGSLFRYCTQLSGCLKTPPATASRPPGPAGASR